MILLCGIPTESPLALVRDHLDAMRTPYVMLSQRRFTEIPFRFEISGDSVTGSFTVDGRRYLLENIVSVYTRLMDYQSLPELSSEPSGSNTRLLARDWHDAVTRWCEIAPICVVNRARSMGSNSSKPFQAQAITRRGFFTPETLITSDPALAREFVYEHQRVIYKSICGVRSIVQEVDAHDLRRLDMIRACPVQFQAYVTGRNVRVHTVGEQVFATGITTTATDYRYAHKEAGQSADLEEVSLSDDLAAQCLALARDLELPFAGIDLKITPDERVYCFEVNPSPAYSYYESHTGQPISAALARYLSAGGALG
jgi:ribosomal protein S6-L-glutamate ligase RimK-like protein